MATPVPQSTPYTQPRLLASLRFVSYASSVAAILVGVLVLLGWTFDIPSLKSIFPGLATMKANTALSFVLAGSTLWLVRKDPISRRARWVARVCALLVATIGGLTLLEYLVGADLGIDQLVFTDPLAADTTGALGRMAPATAFSSLLLGVALLLLSADRAHGLLQLLTLTALGVTLLALAGYVYGVSALYQIGPYSSVAIHTAITFALLCLGILFARADRGLIQIITSASAGGLMARRLLLPALLVPFLLGWLRLKGQQAGLYNTEFGVSLFALAIIIIFTVLIWWTANVMDRIDRERQRTVDELTVEVQARQRAEAELQRQADRARVQAEISRVLAEVTQDYQATLDRAARHLAEIIGDACIVRLVSDDGVWLHLMASFHPDPEAAALVHDILAQELYQRTNEGLTGHAIQTGQPILIPTITSEQLKETIDPARWGLLDRLTISSVLIVPLRAAGHVIGAIAMTRDQPDHPYTDDDLALLQDLADRVALAITNTRLFQQVQSELDERKRLQAQLLQAQKMESIGLLAGGIAHDFNNMLSAIIGFLGSAEEQLPQDSPVQRDLKIAEGSAWRAAGLTRQLLTFAHKQIVEPRVLNLNEVIVEMDKLLRRLIGADIELVTLPAAELGQVKADPGQIEQVIVNLVVNARDAMPNGGRLTIETANTTLDAAYARQHIGVAPGDYVILAVSDTGTGMEAEVQQHIFEPFYTTKEVGKGSGLGLATCYGIVSQHGGNIWVYSEVGHGTTFKVYLPRVYEEADAPSRSADDELVLRGTETVLFVEDEPLVREIARHILHEQGYTVLEAGNGDDALRILQENAGAPIDLLVTDVVMPHMGGKVLAEQVIGLYPNIKVLFISGYAADAIVHHGRLVSGTNFLSKPFTPAALARKVREVLDAAANSPPNTIS